MTAIHPELSPWLVQESLGAVTTTPRGFRDVMWCPYLNEPAIIEYKDGRPHCPNCNGNFEASTHAFIGHVVKP